MVYLVAMVAAAIPLFGTAVCTQYNPGTGFFIIAPVVVLVGLVFVFFAAGWAALQGSLAGGMAFMAYGAGFGVFVAVFAAFLRAEAPKLLGGVLLAGIFFVVLVATFFICASGTV